ncbi:unnamed protein product, partial [Gulo gulo]
WAQSLDFGAGLGVLFVLGSGPALFPGLLIWSMARKYPAASRASNLWRDPGDWEVGGRFQSLGRFRETLESYSWEALKEDTVPHREGVGQVAPVPVGEEGYARPAQ